MPGKSTESLVTKNAESKLSYHGNPVVYIDSETSPMLAGAKRGFTSHKYTHVQLDRLNPL